MSVNAAVVQFVQRRKRFRLFVMLFLLLSVTVSVVIAVVMIRRREIILKTEAQFRGIDLSEVNRKLIDRAEELGIPAEEIDKAVYCPEYFRRLRRRREEPLRQDSSTSRLRL